MDAVLQSSLRHQLLDRRRRLEGVMADLGRADVGGPGGAAQDPAPDLVRLLRTVDAALAGIEGGAYGLCDVCHEEIDGPDLARSPLLRYCLCNLSEDQQRQLEHDLELAARVQWGLLPPASLGHEGWEAHFRYLPAGPVSGDYCDLVAGPGAAGGLHFLLGDVSGKGVAASLLMARLHALFRSLLDQDLSAAELMGRANRLVGENRIQNQYATLVYGRADRHGAVEVCNAGHCPPLLVHHGAVRRVESTGFPVGLFGTDPYRSRQLRLEPGDTLLLYSDGLTEARDKDDEEYGEERLCSLVGEQHALPPPVLAAAILDHQREFLAGNLPADDLTLMVVRRTA